MNTLPSLCWIVGLNLLSNGPASAMWWDSQQHDGSRGRGRESESGRKVIKRVELCYLWETDYKVWRKRRNSQLQLTYNTHKGWRWDTVFTNWDKVWQNPTRIPIVWCFKLANSATSCDKIKSAQLGPSKIWQPWCPNFGNPENQIADLQVFEHA